MNATSNFPFVYNGKGRRCQITFLKGAKKNKGKEEDQPTRRQQHFDVNDDRSPAIGVPVKAPPALAPYCYGTTTFSLTGFSTTDSAPRVSEAFEVSNDCT